MNPQHLQKFALCLQNIAQLLECPICLEVIYNCYECSWQIETIFLIKSDLINLNISTSWYILHNSHTMTNKIHSYNTQNTIKCKTSLFLMNYIWVLNKIFMFMVYIIFTWIYIANLGSETTSMAMPKRSRTLW